MKLSDNDLKNVFEKVTIPEPSDEAEKKAIQLAVEEFRQSESNAEKKSKGFLYFLRHMGETLRKVTTIKGEPIMTTKSFATVGIAVIAVGVFLTIGTQIQISSRKDMQEYGSGGRVTNNLPVGDDKATISKESAVSKPADTIKRKVAITTESVAKRPDLENRLTQEREAEEVQTPVFRSYMQENKREIPSAGKLTRLADPARPAGLVEGEQFLDRDESGTYYKDTGRDTFEAINVNPVKIAAAESVSTFSLDVDTASYAFVRRQLNSGVLPQKNAVRIEEMINYFDYDYTVPSDKSKPFAPTVAVYPTPWNTHTKILHIGIKGYDIAPAEKPKSNLVFLLDVSGSMNSPDKLPLLKNSFSMLVDSLSPEDTVGIVVYAGAAGTILEPTHVKEKGKIFAALDKLQAGGSTAGGEGIRLAYSLAKMNFEADAVNRVILATDGDFNVGITNREELKSFIERQRKTGIYLSVVGFGQGNYNDSMMQTLAQNGNGNAAYIDNFNEARKVLVDEASSTLFTIAKDVKIQVEFNPAMVHDYRLIGYETRMLKREDFNNDQVDAGDVGSGHSVTAIYEITPVGSREKLIDPLRYQTQTTPVEASSSEYAFLKIRYKLPNSDTSNLITKPVGTDLENDSMNTVSQEMRFGVSVAAFGQMLRNDPYTKEFNYDDLIALAEPARGRDPFGYRTEFLNLVRLAKTARAM